MARGSHLYTRAAAGSSWRSTGSSMLTSSPVTYLRLIPTPRRARPPESCWTVCASSRGIAPPMQYPENSFCFLLRENRGEIPSRDLIFSATARLNDARAVSSAARLSH